MIVEMTETGRHTELGDKFVLCYMDKEIIVLDFNAGQTSTRNMLEVFKTAQEMADRCVELDLNIQIHHMISALEYGVELTEPRKSYFWDNVWTVGTEEEKDRLEALGYTES